MSDSLGLLEPQGGGGGYSGFQVPEMIERGQKSKPQKSLDQKLTSQKSHVRF